MTQITRGQIQGALEPIVAETLVDLGLDPLDLGPDHARRTVRALLRLAVQVARRHGCGLGSFLGVAVEAFLAEAQAVVTPARPPKPKAQA